MELVVNIEGDVLNVRLVHDQMCASWGSRLGIGPT